MAANVRRKARLRYRSIQRLPQFPAKFVLAPIGDAGPRSVVANGGARFRALRRPKLVDPAPAIRERPRLASGFERFRGLRSYVRPDCAAAAGATSRPLPSRHNHPEITKANPRQIGGERRFADAADARQSTQCRPGSRPLERGEKPGCGIFPAQKEFVGPPPIEFGQRTRIRCNFALKGAVTTMQPSPARPMRKRDWTEATPIEPRPNTTCRCRSRPADPRRDRRPVPGASHRRRNRSPAAPCQA
jgi:hypothetical protein